MSDVVGRKTLEDYIAILKRKIDRLEAGGKPMVGISPVSSTGEIILAAGADIGGIAATLSWANANVLTNPKATPHVAIYIDNDEDNDYLWPSGVGLSSGQRNLQADVFMDLLDLVNNPERTRARLYLRNKDSSQHSYFVYIAFTYMTGGSGSE